MKKQLSLVCVLLLMPWTASATTVSPNDLVTELQNLLARIQRLEAENALYKDVIARHGIQIPLDEYNAALSGASSVTPTVSPPQNTENTTSHKATGATPIQQGFIDQIQKDWEGIRGAYVLDPQAEMAGYEFVKNDAGNVVFVDILYPQRTQAGAYNVKLLYEFNTETFARTLLGLFVFDDNAKAYVTQRGGNAFAKHERQFIANPYYRGIATPPVTATITPVSSPTTPTDTLNALKTAYDARTYDRVIQISDAYLGQHAPTFDVLQYRYRTFFITKEYQKALQEIKRLESLGYVTNMLYCDAHVIALYAKESALAQTYKTKAGAECKVVN